jgi:hypothetical protein
MAMRDGTYVADDAIPAFIGLSRDERVVSISRGGTARLVGGPGMTLTGATARLYQWTDLSFRSGELPEVKGPATGGSARPDGRGGLLLTAPPPGEYAVELGIRWTTACLQGDGVAYARVTVR